MKKNIIKWCLGILVGVNLFLLLSGVIIPWLISTDQLPVTVSFLLVTTILMIIVGIIFYMASKFATYALKKLTDEKTTQAVQE